MSRADKMLTACRASPFFSHLCDDLSNDTAVGAANHAPSASPTSYMHQQRVPAPLQMLSLRNCSSNAVQLLGNHPYSEGGEPRGKVRTSCCAVLQVAAGRRHVGIMGLELVGNYAVR
jgi:hypothetical protein